MRRKARPAGGRQIEVTIEEIGARGDGYGRGDGGLVFVPFTVPGDRAVVRLSGTRSGGAKGEVVELLAEGPRRATPTCPHFGPCGGCALQHLSEDYYVRWKQTLIPQALARRRLGGHVVRPMIRVPPGTRRRAVLAAEKRGATTRLGLHGRDTHGIVDLSTCGLLRPSLVAVLGDLRGALNGVLGEGARARITVSEMETGLDVLIAAPGTPDLTAREALAHFAAEGDLDRLSWARARRDGGADAPEAIVVRRPPRVTFAGVTVEPPAGAFLQPSVAGQEALTREVLTYLPGACATALDLFAGCGTFTFPISTRARVHAVEGDGAALAALWAGARRSDLAHGVSVEQRDLARAPVRAAELSEYDCVVFDPPRAGAREQAAALAGCSVPVVIGISCNPNSFARDARILVDGGYSLVEITPVDQFPWSGHLELVAQFRKN